MGILCMCDRGDIREMPAPFAQLCCELKTALKYKVYLKKKDS